MVLSKRLEFNVAGPKIRTDDKGKVRIRFMEVELEGSNETLLEGIRSITAAMPGQVIHTRVVQKTLNGRVQPTNAGPASLGSAEANPDDDAHEEFPETPEDAVADPPDPPRRPRSQRAPKAPALSENLRLDDAPTPFREFCDSTTITSDSGIMDKAIVVATWLRDHRQQDSMSASDLYTCCKFMDWDPPTDVTSPMRNLKRDQKMNSVGRGSFTLTMLGDKQFRSLKK